MSKPAKKKGGIKPALWIGLAEKKLATSGLTLEDAVKLGIEPLSGDQMQDEHKAFKALAALKIPYFDLAGKPLSDVPGGEPFERFRYLEKPKGFDEQNKEVRYVQRAGTAPVAYFPRGYCNWEEIAADPSIPICITEGELKAAKACKEGFPTVGLGGVFNWQAKKLGIMLIPSLNLINWVRRRVFVVYDSDMFTNPQVCGAAWEFAQDRERAGSFVFLVHLPNLPQLAKTGLDDFLVHEGKSAAEKFKQLLATAEPLGLAQPLWAMNDRFTYVANPGAIVDRTSNQKIAPSAFVQHHQSTTIYQERTLRPNGTISYKAVSAAAAWIKWPMRSEVDRLTYAPGEKFFITKNGTRYLNQWPGMGVEPKKGDVSPFLELVDHLFTGSDPGAKEHFLKWTAFPLQNPGVKMFTSYLMWGTGHGTGKSLVGETIGAIYGRNFAVIGSQELHSDFNAWAENKQFILGDEVVTKETRRGEVERLKRIITQLVNRINEKFIAAYEVPDCCNYYFTSNYPDAFFMDDQDRRNNVNEVTVGPLPEAFYIRYRRWLNSDGPAALYYYLLHEVDCEDFNPAAPAMRTSAKERMIAHGFSDHGAWVRQLMSAPDVVLKINDVPIEKDLFTAKELLALYDPAGHNKQLTAIGMGRELAKCGVRQVNLGRPVALPSGEQARYFAVRNIPYWLDAKLPQIVKHLVDYNDKKKRRKF